VNFRNARVAGNTIHDGTGGSGISVRFPAVVIENNDIYNTNTGISYYDYASSSLTSTVRFDYNRIWGVASGIWIDRNAGDTNTVDNHQTFIINNNDIHTANKPIYDVAYGAIGVNWTSGAVRIANNIVIPYAGQAHLRIDSRPAGGYEERNNWFDAGSSTWNYGGTAYSTLSAYQSASGQGANDLRASVGSSVAVDSTWVQQPTSPSVDAGTTSVTGVTFTADSTGAPNTYAGLLPDIGAVEYRPVGGTDTMAPSTPGALAQSGSTNTSVTVQWSPATDNVGISGYEVAVNGIVRGTTSSTSYTVGGLTTGTSYTVQVVALDAAGNRSAPAQIAATTTAATTPPADTTAPTVSIQNPTDGATVGRSVTIGATASDASGITELTILVDGVVVGSTSSTSLTCTASLKGGGWHTITARAVDTAGNASTTNVRVRAAK
jgi:chitodextrinase